LGDCGELETGETTLAFAALSLGESQFPAVFVAAHESLKPLGMELAFVTASVASAHAKALAAGATKSTRRLQNRGASGVVGALPGWDVGGVVYACGGLDTRARMHGALTDRAKIAVFDAARINANQRATFFKKALLIGG
jgi:hypothetical protein